MDKSKKEQFNDLFRDVFGHEYKFNHSTFVHETLKTGIHGGPSGISEEKGLDLLII